MSFAIPARVRRSIGSKNSMNRFDRRTKRATGKGGRRGKTGHEARRVAARLALLCAAGNTCTEYKVMATLWIAAKDARGGSTWGRRGRRGAAGKSVISSSPPTPGERSQCNERTGLGEERAPIRGLRGRSSRNRSRGPITRTSSLPGRLASHWDQGICHRSAPRALSLPSFSTFHREDIIAGPRARSAK